MSEKIETFVHFSSEKRKTFSLSQDGATVGLGLSSSEPGGRGDEQAGAGGVLHVSQRAQEESPVIIIHSS